jgi:ATP/maltotriose-dependent transcriptional regulator MalT
MEAMRGDYTGARRRLDEVLAVLEEIGQIVGWMAWAVYYECGAFIARLERDYPRMEALLRNIVDERTMANPSIMLASDVAWLAEAVDEQGRHAEAAKLCAISERLATRDDVLSQLFWRSVKARALAREGQVQPALRLTGAAVQLAERTDALNWQANAWMDQARVLRLAGLDREAEHALRGAIERYRRKGNVVSAAVAHAQLTKGLTT